jgi:hypothetical protein
VRDRAYDRSMLLSSARLDAELDFRQQVEGSVRGAVSSIA